MCHRTLEPAYDALEVSGMIACKAAIEEKPYHKLEKCAQNGDDRSSVSFGFFPCEYSCAEYEESDHGFEEPCQLLGLVICGGCMEGSLGVASHKWLHMGSFQMQYGRKYCTTIQ